MPHPGWLQTLDTLFVEIGSMPLGVLSPLKHRANFDFCVLFCLNSNTYQDAKFELGWADFQAQKYRAWHHHLALTALALWFIAETKLDWQALHPQDPKLMRQLKVKALPQLSVANVRDLLRAALPLPNISQDDAERIVVSHLINRARSTRSYADAQRVFHGPDG